MSTHRQPLFASHHRRIRFVFAVCLAIGLFAAPAVSVWAMSCQQAERGAQHCQNSELAFDAPPCHQSAALVCCDQRTTLAEQARSGLRAPIDRDLQDNAPQPTDFQPASTTASRDSSVEPAELGASSGRSLLAHKATLQL